MPTRTPAATDSRTAVDSRTRNPLPAAVRSRSHAPARGRPTSALAAQPTLVCANCEIPIAGPPTIHVGVAFCCAGCVVGGPCTCTYDDAQLSSDPAAGWVVRDCLDVSALDAEREVAARRG